MNTQTERNLVPFAFGENLVRSMLDENGNPWFVAKDVCRVLGIENVGNVLAALDKDEKITIHNPDGNPREGIPHSYALISESGLYALVFRSRKPEAKAFSKWVRAEVLPALRRTGTYTMPRAASGSGRCVMPDIPEMYALKPTVRQNLWRDALQTARLDDAGSEAAVEWFRQLCRMMTAGFAPSGGAEEETRRIIRFAEEMCRKDEHGRVNATKLYDAFTAWWCGKFDEPVPSQHIFGRVMPTRFARRKRGGKTVYFGVCLERQAA